VEGDVVVDEGNLFVVMLVDLCFEAVEEFQDVSGQHPWWSPVPFG